MYEIPTEKKFFEDRHFAAGAREGSRRGGDDSGEAASATLTTGQPGTSYTPVVQPGAERVRAWKEGLDEDE